MNDAIKVVHLTKAYQIYSSAFDSLKDALFGGSRYQEKIVLNDLSFNIKRGEVVGIIGKNGAGKSTLLKILAGTLNASQGSITVSGKISAILELGTGFHPEYTGRENIILGGMCMGMSKKEVLSKQDQIIEFSELEDVIDQPFKTYSSGMQARLTFSTAISVSPDILIIDEALAAGDSAFVEKCLGRIDQIARSGATVLLVTHNTNLIPRFGNRAIWIDNGKIKLDGDACYVSKQYEIDSFLRVQKSSDNKNLEKIGDQLIFLDYVQLQGSPYKDDVYIQGCSLGIKLVFVSKIHSDTAEIYVQIARDDGLVVWTCTSYEYMNLDHKISSFPIIFKPGVNEVAIEIPNILFNVGRYVINVGIEPARDTPRIVDYHDWVRYAFLPKYGTSKRVEPPSTAPATKFGA